MKGRVTHYRGSAATPAERAIARKLGVTPAGLATLLRIMRGDDVSGGMAGVRLEQQGLVTAERRLTEAGRRAVADARALGY